MPSSVSLEKPRRAGAVGPIGHASVVHADAHARHAAAAPVPCTAQGREKRSGGARARPRRQAAGVSLACLWAPRFLRSSTSSLAWAGQGQAIRACRCRATDQGASLPRQDRWRGRPCHVTGQRSRSSPRHPPAAPPCMEWHRRFTAPW